MMENTFDYIRFFFHTGRQDSEFWKYMSNNIPDNIKDLDDLIKSGGYLCKEHIFQDLMFEHSDFNVIAYHNGLYKNKEAIVTLLKSKYLYDHSGNTLNEIRKIKDRYKINAVDHKLWIESIKEGRLY